MGSIFFKLPPKQYLFVTMLKNMICLSRTYILVLMLACIFMGQVRQSNVLYSFESHSVGMGRLNPSEVRSGD